MEVNLQNNIIPAKMLSAACWWENTNTGGIFLEALSILDSTETSTKKTLYPSILP